MRILMFTDRFPPEIRSAAHLYHDLARGLQKRGHDVAVITAAPFRYVARESQTASQRGWDDVDGVPTLRVKSFPAAGFNPILRGFDQLALGLKFERVARKWPDADGLLVYSPPLPLANAAIRYARRFGSAVILNVQDIYPQTVVDLGLLKNRVAIRFAERLERRAYQNASHIVVHSSGNKELLTTARHVAASKVSVIHNWVSEVHQTAADSDGFRSAFGLSDQFVVSYAGVMGYAQDLSTVINGATLLQTDPAITFLLVGEGALEPRWKQMVADRGLRNVRFLPMLQREEYSRLLSASDICLIPLDPTLRTPVVPGKLQSIMAAGRPALAIVNNGSETSKLLQTSGAGVQVSPNDAAALSETVAYLKREPAIRAEMGICGRQFASEHFSLAGALDAYEALFTRLISESRGRLKLEPTLQIQ